jgi:hypothetical protein
MQNITNTREYGDLHNLTSDIKTITDILNRQGANLVLDVIGEFMGDASNRFKLSTTEREKLIRSTIENLENALSERL